MKNSLLKLNKKFWGTTAIIYIVFFCLELLVFSQYKHENVFGIKGADWNWGWAVFWLQVSYTLLSLRIIGPTELGARLVLGRPTDDLKSGIVFIPLGVCQLMIESCLVMQEELPADPEKVYRGKRDEPEVVPDNLLKLGYKPPIRIPFGIPNLKLPESAKELGQLGKKLTEEDRVELELNKVINKSVKKIREEAKEDPLNVRMIAEVAFIIRYRVSSLTQFLKTIGNRQELLKQIQDTAVAALTRMFSKFTPAIALNHLGTASSFLQNEIKERVKGGKKTASWGIVIETAQIKSITFSHELAIKILEIPEAQAARKAAEFTKEADRLKGEGKGAEQKAIIDGWKDGLKELIKETGVSPDNAFNQYTNSYISQIVAPEIAKSPNTKIVLTGAGMGGFSGLINAAAAFGAVMSEKPSPTTAPTPSKPEKTGEERRK